MEQKTIGRFPFWKTLRPNFLTFPFKLWDKKNTHSTWEYAVFHAHIATPCVRTMLGEMGNCDSDGKKMKLNKCLQIATLWRRNRNIPVIVPWSAHKKTRFPINTNGLYKQTICFNKITPQIFVQFNGKSYLIGSVIIHSSTLLACYDIYSHK